MQPIFSQNERCKFLIHSIKLYFYDKKVKNLKQLFKSFSDAKVRI